MRTIQLLLFILVVIDTLLLLLVVMVAGDTKTRVNELYSLWEPKEKEKQGK